MPAAMMPTPAQMATAHTVRKSNDSTIQAKTSHATPLTRKSHQGRRPLRSETRTVDMDASRAPGGRCGVSVSAAPPEVKDRALKRVEERISRLRQGRRRRRSGQGRQRGAG